MKIGVFVPIGNNGWLISTHAPQYMPTFELNKAIVQKAEHYHFDFALSMIKLRGFGGKTEFWDHNLESFTLMAGLAAVTSRIQIYATAATLTLPPAIVARMAATIDSISGGRFGVNLVTGWQKPEYEQMGIWPGDDYFSRRYDYLTEYVQVLRDLWGTGKSDFKGDFFTMNDCRVSPQPSVPHESDLRRAKRRWHGVLRPVCRFQLLFRQRCKYTHGFRPDRCADETGRRANRARRWLLCIVYGDCR